MTFDEVFQSLKQKFPEWILEKVETKPDPFIKVNPQGIGDVLLYMRDHLDFETLASLGGVDEIKTPALVVVYHPFSYKHKLVVAIKTFLPRQDGVTLPSVCSVYKAANWLERETYDLFGIHFSDHPDHRRILCPEDWVGFALRKDYVVPDYYNGMPVPLFFEEPQQSTSETVTK